MIYIATAESDGSAIYFDIHAAERKGGGLRVSGMVGDGSYEGEVLVETGHEVAVTFADAWLGGAGFREFLRRCGPRQLEAALVESVLNLPKMRVRRTAPRGCGVKLDDGRTAEAGPSWLVRA